MIEPINITHLAMDMKARSTPEFNLAEVSKNLIENSSASFLPVSYGTFCGNIGVIKMKCQSSDP